MTKKNILFDFDGVIVDSFAACFEVSRAIHPILTEETYRKRFEGNINHAFTDQEHDDRCRHDINFFDELRPRLAQAPVFEGMLDVIDELHKEYRLVIVSSTISAPIREYLEGHNIANHFDDILGNDIHTSKVEKIKMVLQKYTLEAGDCVFVTDTLGDMREAAEVGVGAIAVSWGFQRHATLEQGKPFRVVDAPADLLKAVSAYFHQ